jgi:hypothetical protein
MQRTGLVRVTRSLARLAKERRPWSPRAALSQSASMAYSVGQGTGATNETGLFVCLNAFRFGVPK